MDVPSVAKLDGHHLIIKCTIEDTPRRLDTHSLIDCGASGFAFIDMDFVQQHNFPLHSLRDPRRLEVIDGRPIDSEDITHVAKVGLDINGHREQVSAFVTKLGHYPFVLGIPCLRYHNPRIDWEKDTVDFVSPRCTTTCAPRPTKATTMDIPPRRPRTMDIAAVSLAGFRRTVRREKRLHEAATTFAISAADIDAMLRQLGQDQDPEISEEYQEFATLFSEQEANRLPPHQPGDHRIQLCEGTAPSFGPLYTLSKQEIEALRKWLDENLARGFIRPSSSPAGSPILFVKKKDGSLRLCVDYRDLNEKTLKNRYPLPLIQETLMQLSKAKYFTKLNIRGAYNLIRMAEGDEWKTAFRTWYGLFESLVLFCFESIIYNPLHVARRAMAAAMPLPSTGQRRGFLRYTHFLPRTSLCGYVEVTPFSFSPRYRQTKEKEIIMTTKERQRRGHILDGWARAPLISTRTDLGFHIFPRPSQ